MSSSTRLPSRQSSPSSPNKPRLFIVSNRGLAQVKKGQNGEFTLDRGDGGLVSAFQGMMDLLKNEFEFKFVCSPGVDSPKHNLADHESKVRELLEPAHCLPVFVSVEDYEGYYNGYANGVLWPAMHTLPKYIEKDARTRAESFMHYKSVNTSFAEKVVDNVRDGDYVWVHDYHFFLLPGMIRKRLEEKGIRLSGIGFFLHTPFPRAVDLEYIDGHPTEQKEKRFGKPETGDVYKSGDGRNQRRELLHGMCGADLIDFHTTEFTHNFSECVKAAHLIDETSFVKGNGKKGVKKEYLIPLPTHITYAGTLPIGIDPGKWREKMKEFSHGKVSILAKKIQKYAQLQGRKILVGVDRFDYTKGLDLKLEAYEEFLEDNRDEPGKCVLIQVAVPTREAVSHYKDLVTIVKDRVAAINKTYGTEDWQPIHFIHDRVDHGELTHLYGMSQVALVTPVRDGMNLVAFEYVVTQEEHHGVLILSGKAGAASYLKQALIIEPTNVPEVAETIQAALDMSPDERKERENALDKFVKRNTAAEWGANFVHRMSDIHSQKGNGTRASHTNTPLSPPNSVSDRGYNSARRLATQLPTQQDSIGNSHRRHSLYFPEARSAFE